MDATGQRSVVLTTLALALLLGGIWLWRQQHQVPAAVATAAVRLAASPLPVGEQATVTKVNDGDTVEVTLQGKNERVRMLGINTPESVDPHRPVQCYGPEASHRNKLLLSGQPVVLQKDTARPEDRDKYGRLLRYVWRADGLHVNHELLLEGFAYEYTFQNQHYAYQSAFKQAEAEAKAAHRGLWAAETCAGRK